MTPGKLSAADDATEMSDFAGLESQYTDAA